jgi:hypothetical protein
MATADNPQGHIDLIDECPVCGGDIEPHCDSDPSSKFYSSTCDIVRCIRCKNKGSIDGRWWPNPIVVVIIEDELP